jgi:oligopeptide transport system substrate-binding protein
VSVGGQEIGSASCDIPWPEVEPPIPATLFLAFNTAQPPFDIPEVRRALAMAIDREALLDLLGREDTLAAEGLVPPSIWADESYYGQADVPFDSKRALALLGEAGEPDVVWVPYPLILASESSLEVAQFIQAQWKEHLGIEVDLTVVEEDAYAEGLEALSPHVFLASWYADWKSPYNFLGDAVQDISKLTKWSNAEYDRLIEEAFQEANQNRRMELYGEAEWILCYDEAGIIPIYYYTHVDYD